MSGGDSGENRVWVTTLVLGLILIVGAWALVRSSGQSPWVHAVLLGAGGLSVVFAACELLIKAVRCTRAATRKCWAR